MTPTIKNGGKHPSAIKYGNTTLPINAPNLPNIITNEIIIVLRKNCFLKILYYKLLIHQITLMTLEINLQQLQLMQLNLYYQQIQIMQIKSPLLLSFSTNINQFRMFQVLTVHILKFMFKIILKHILIFLYFQYLLKIFLFPHALITAPAIK